MLRNFIITLRRRRKRQPTSSLAAFAEDVLIDVLRFFTRRQLCQLELSCRLLAHIVQTHFAKTPYLLFAHAEYNSGWGKCLNYRFLFMRLQIYIPAISMGWRRNVTLKSIANGQVAVPTYLRFSTFEFTSYGYKKMLENRIEAVFYCWQTYESGGIWDSPSRWLWTHTRLLQRGAIEWGDVIPRLVHAIGRTKISYSTSCADKFGSRKQLGDYLAEQIAPLFGANVNCRNWCLHGSHLSTNTGDVDDVPLLQRSPFLTAHSIILEIHDSKESSSSKMFSEEEILDWLHRTHTQANCPDCNCLRSRTMRLCTPSSFLGNCNWRATREAIENGICKILERAQELFLAAVTTCPYQLEISLETDFYRQKLLDHYLGPINIKNDK